MCHDNLLHLEIGTIMSKMISWVLSKNKGNYATLFGAKVWKNELSNPLSS